MKLAPFFIRSAALLLMLGGSLCAQDNRAATSSAGGKPKNGYTVTVDIHVDDKGEVKNVELTDTNDTTTGDVLTKMAVAMALKTDMPVREKEGKPISYTARVPFFFPIEDDEGPAANDLPKPRVKNAVQPVYPLELRDQGVVGGAIFELVVDEEGKLTHLSTLRASHPEFEAAAKEALNKWEFTPAQQDGQPVRSRSRIAMVYETQGKMADLKWRVPPRPSLGAFMVIRPDGPIDESMFDPAPAEGEAPAETAPAATKE